MSLRVIDRRFTQMIAYFLVMNSKRCSGEFQEFWSILSGDIVDFVISLHPLSTSYALKPSLSIKEKLEYFRNKKGYQKENVAVLPHLKGLSNKPDLFTF